MRRWKNGIIFQYFRYYNISLTSASLYTFASFISPFRRLDYFPLLRWLLWPLHSHTCCSIKITDNSADISLIKILEEKERFILPNKRVSLKPDAHLSFNELLRDWSYKETMCSVVVCSVGGALLSTSFGGHHGNFLTTPWGSWYCVRSTTKGTEG